MSGTVFTLFRWIRFLTGYVVNEIVREYNDLAMLTKEYQEHGGVYGLGQGPIPNAKLPIGGANPPSGLINSSWNNPGMKTQVARNHDLFVEWDCCASLKSKPY